MGYRPKLKYCYWLLGVIFWFQYHRLELRFPLLIAFFRHLICRFSIYYACSNACRIHLVSVFSFSGLWRFSFGRISVLGTSILSFGRPIVLFLDILLCYGILLLPFLIFYFYWYFPFIIIFILHWYYFVWSLPPYL